MASAPSKTITTKTVNNKTGITKSVSTTTSGGSTTTTKTTTIGKPTSVSSSSSVSSPAAAPGCALGAQWITGPNDTGWTMCGAVAIANHLLDVTGIEATNADIEKLYRRAGATGDSGAPLEFFLDAAATTGIAGCRLAAYDLTLHVEEAGVLLLDMDGVPGLHAAARTRDGDVVLWGSAAPLQSFSALIINAWSLTWHGEVNR